ncbi:5380_t:CDS:2, partial [Gigaspora rosea]
LLAFLGTGLLFPARWTYRSGNCILEVSSSSVEDSDSKQPASFGGTY